MRRMNQLSVSGKRVIVRVDFNVPVEHGVVKDDYRIKASLPTIQALLKKRASVIVITHLGRPDGVRRSDLSLVLVAKIFAKFLRQRVLFARTLEEAEMLAKILKPGEVLMLENIRFYPGETENVPAFAKRLAALGNVYINDAFGVAHRAHASIVGIPKILPHAAGLLLWHEVETLQKVFIKPRRPMVAIIGGAKIASKLPLIKRFLKKADVIIVGGAIANTILAAKHISIGKSYADTDIDIPWLHLRDKKFYLPIDAVVTKSLEKSGGMTTRGIGDIRADEYIADIGSDSIRLFEELIKKAGTIIWNGPLGFIETHSFERGTKILAKKVASLRAFTVIGGGDLHRVFRDLKLDRKIDYISTGGGAMLEFLAGKKLPGIEALK